jgi:predicted small metal-binding protein
MYMCRANCRGRNTQVAYRTDEFPDMKSFACGDVVPGCDARFVCDTEDEILAAVAAHARLDHGLASVPAELVTAVRAAIQPVGV